MKSGVKKYNTAYKKRVLERDTYLPLLSPKGIIQCSGCGAFYYRRHWTLNPPSGFSYPVHAHPIYCAACRKIRDRFPGGELQLLGVEAGERGRSSGSCGTRRSAHGKKIRSRGLCACRKRGAIGRWRRPRKSLRKDLAVRSKRREAATSPTSGVITTNSSEWFGKKERSRRRGSSGYHSTMTSDSLLGNPNSNQKTLACTPARQRTSFAIHWRVARLTFSILLSAGSRSSV